mgnify:FL=1
MVGSRDSISECNVVLNTIAAEVFRDACDRLEAADDFDTAVHDLIKEYAIQHQLLYSTETDMHRSGRQRQRDVDFRSFRPW